MQGEYRSYLRDMLGRARWIARSIAGRTREQFGDDLALQDTITRSLEIIGEAAKHVPEDVREQYPYVDWRGFARFRDVIAHAYFRLNLDVVWHAAQASVPSLAEHLTAILADLGEDPDGQAACDE